MVFNWTVSQRSLSIFLWYKKYFYFQGNSIHKTGPSCQHSILLSCKGSPLEFWLPRREKPRWQWERILAGQRFLQISSDEQFSPHFCIRCILIKRCQSQIFLSFMQIHFPKVVCICHFLLKTASPVHSELSLNQAHFASSMVPVTCTWHPKISVHNQVHKHDHKKWHEFFQHHPLPRFVPLLKLYSSKHPDFSLNDNFVAIPHDLNFLSICIGNGATDYYSFPLTDLYYSKLSASATWNSSLKNLTPLQ